MPVCRKQEGECSIMTLWKGGDLKLDEDKG